ESLLHGNLIACPLPIPPPQAGRGRTECAALRPNKRTCLKQTDASNPTLPTPRAIGLRFSSARGGLMQVGFFFWPYTPELCDRLAERADRSGYAMIGIADTPGNAMDPWVSAAIVARACRRARVAIWVTNLLTRHPAVSAAAIASLDHLANGRAVLGIGAGHSGTKNVGLAKSRADALADALT